jgi:hypothetical protein
MAATITKLRSRQSAIEGGGLMLDARVGVACERIGRLSAKRPPRQHQPISRIGNETAENAMICGWESPTTAAGRIDAHARASKLKDAREAAAALGAADLQGDEGMAKAIAATAFDHAAGLAFLGRPWAEIVDDYESSPGSRRRCRESGADVEQPAGARFHLWGANRKSSRPGRFMSF